ncbi:mechanosensitive ion channel family protein [Lacisediminihabitans changchengi]|uniref:Mechanosensitive ion channel n=1 Tax=Lacisediminihabitans changchengi TaxID=2787634 RepID=A0A934W4S3_9MICO|nr:mechanosensitive ion channel domain-containing protein [Lacisediminihabitans changchengi]MBK4348574.1 mechanosensitive ion channel [Lacisediminihabitans changchengi]
MFEWTTWWGLALAVVIAAVAAVLVIAATTVLVRVASHGRDWGRLLRSRARHPFRVLLVVVALWIAVAMTWPLPVWAGRVNHGFLILTIAVATWFLTNIVGFALGLTMGYYRTDVPDNRLRRRLRTQLIIVRRLASVIIVIVGIAAILLTFPGVQAVGASVLASAGVVSVIAGLAAQSTLGNVFAGVQLAFNDALRVDDVVVADGEWGRIEEITLTYVVVHIWDDRRLVLPSTYFTTTPFENWTRNSSELLGSVEFDLDWRVSPVRMRERLEQILAGTTLWDQRASVLQVTDAVGGFVRVRILVTAIDAPTLFDLRCLVREQMVEWLQSTDPEALPHSRIEIVQDQPAPRPSAPSTDTGGLFHGSAEADERASQFTTSIPIQNPAARADQA